MRTLARLWIAAAFAWPVAGIAAAETPDEGVRIARFPWFARGALTIIYESVPAPDVPDHTAAGLAEMLARRERPDLATAVVSAEAAPAWTAWGHEIAAREGDHLVVRRADGALLARVPSARPVPADQAPVLVPGPDLDLHALPAIRLARFDTAAAKALCERAIAERGWIIAVITAPGPTDEAATDLLHDYHAELWNGTLGAMARYQDQARHAETALEALPGDPGWVARYTDRRGTDAPPDPVELSFQRADPVNALVSRAVQSDRQRWSAIVARRLRWSQMPGTATITLEAETPATRHPADP